ncbi:uncharacterized protein EV422DRAFT_572494 [Fimicolochytrium jonesii]|uniref:uncharacterized protein n=1 Tax=Fimicolochytrium jonesii TaxID=1396493 RepID=UPI0022FDC675|nr:uncharacterized protein EV422DRAFT_572494 [Fimicolochytrium jonesii]KAI8815795.1 hypothetical protein EV422DRAFT_572494 [Fimicolochytrium jonesii]
MHFATTILALVAAAASVQAIPPAITPRDAEFKAMLEKRGTTNCGSGAGWPTDTLMPKVCDALAMNGKRTATIQLRNQRTSDHSFAYISKNYKSGDRISNDLSNKGYSMRACMDMVDGGFVCTAWYKEDLNGEHVKVGGKKQQS